MLKGNFPRDCVGMRILGTMSSAVGRSPSRQIHVKSRFLPTESDRLLLIDASLPASCSRIFAVEKWGGRRSVKLC